MSGTIIQLRLTNDPAGYAAVAEAATAEPWATAGLTDGTATSAPYATFEPDFWLLDGSFDLFPDDLAGLKMGYVRNALTNGAGVYGGSPPAAVHARFVSASGVKTARDIDKITIRGLEATGDHPTLIKASYYKAGALAQEKTIGITSVEFEFTNPVNCDEVRLAVLSTNKPYRRPRIREITFGDTLVFRGGQIIQSSFIREESLIGTELPAGTFTATLASDDSATFDIMSSTSLFAQLHTRMAFDVLFDRGRRVEYIGRYYLTAWEQVNAYQLRIDGVDVVGLLDEINYAGDFWKTNVAFEAMIRRVLSFAPDIKTVTIAGGFVPAPMKGFVPNGTLRDAVKQVLFAAGARMEIRNGDQAYIEAQRSQNLSGNPDAVFTAAEKGLEGQALSIRPSVTRIELFSNDYGFGASKELYKATLPVGTHTVYFERPVNEITVTATGATIVEPRRPACVTLNVLMAGEVTVNGSEYVLNKVLNAEDLSEGAEKPNVIKIEDVTVQTLQNAPATLERLSNYFLQKFEQKFKVYNAEQLSTGRLFKVVTSNNKSLRGVVSRVSVDMSGGMIAEYNVVGIGADESASGSRLISCGSLGSVSPRMFAYPSSVAQTFRVTLQSAYAMSHGIGIKINGSYAQYIADSKVFTLATTDAYTTAEVSFPMVSREVTTDDIISATPGRFFFPSSTPQAIYFKKPAEGAAAEDNAITYIAVTVDGVKTLYDANEKTIVLQSTTEATAVSVAREYKQKRNISFTEQITYMFAGSINTIYHKGGTPYFYYPMTTPQLLSSGGMYDYNGYVPHMCTIQWYAPNEGLNEISNSIGSTGFYLTSSSANTTVACIFSLDAQTPTPPAPPPPTPPPAPPPFTPWLGTINEYGAPMLPSPAGSYVTAWLAYGTKVIVTEVVEALSTDPQGLTYKTIWYRVSVQNGANAGATGYVLHKYVTQD